jgi:carbamoyltransferase
VKSLFIHPGMGDEGLAFGAAVGSMGSKQDTTHLHAPIPDVYLGPGYADAEIEGVLNRRGMPYHHYEHVERKIAELLRDGCVVARFNGRMEYGPRALGNRSILFHPADKSVNDWLNVSLHRTEFMPFAPALKMDLGRRCFHDIAGAEQAAKFMTITFECTDEMKRLCPGVVHVDGSARPQFVTPESNPSYYKIIDEFYQLTGIPSVINTSFNVHDEPIVCSPHDAVNGFLDGGLDYLAIGPFMVKNPKGVPKRQPPVVGNEH